MSRILQTEERTERRISAVTSLSMCALTVIAQIAITLLLTRFLREKTYVVYAALEIMGAIFAIRVYQRPGSPSYKLAWMCLLLALPVSGMILFCLWGGTHQAKSLSMRKVPPIRERESTRMESEANLARLRRQSPEWGRLAAYLQKRGFLLYRNTDAKYFPDGTAFFDDLIERMRLYLLRILYPGRGADLEPDLLRFEGAGSPRRGGTHHLR